MAARGSKSKKESAASSASKSPRERTFFIDRCLGRNVVPGALRDAGANVEVMDDHFSSDVEDRIWLPEVGRRGWIVLSKDASIRYNHIEVLALLRANTHAFLLTSAQCTGDQMAAAFVAALGQMFRIVGKFQPPVIASISKSGNVRIRFTYADFGHNR
jgi:hypothetical protein